MNKLLNKMLKKTKIKKMDIHFTLILVLLLVFLYLIYVTFRLNEGFETTCSELPSKLKKDDKQLVLFYADWCGHCNKMKPEWDEASNELGNNKMMKINVGDGTEEQKKTMNTYGIKGFPTILMFENGESKGPFEYRDKNSYLEFFI